MKTGLLIDKLKLSLLTLLTVGSASPAWSVTVLPPEGLYYCEVVSAGQLSLRSAPGGKKVASLNAGDVVDLTGKSREGLDNGVLVGTKYGGRSWVKVTVKKATNSRLKNKIGYVESKYLSCK
jgi:Bacterial SH3 domain